MSHNSDFKESSFVRLKDIEKSIVFTGNANYNSFQPINISINNINNSNKIDQQDVLSINSSLDLIYKSLKEIKEAKGDLSSILERIFNEINKLRLASSSKKQYQIISEDKFSIFGEKRLDENKYNYFVQKNKKEIYNKIVLNGFFTIKSQKFKNKRKESYFNGQEKNRYEFNNNKNEMQKELKKQVKRYKSEIKILKKEVNTIRKEVDTIRKEQSSKINNNCNLYDYINSKGYYRHPLYNENLYPNENKENFIDRVKKFTNELNNTIEINKRKSNFYYKK